jgi:hypothetical protein
MRCRFKALLQFVRALERLQQYEEYTTQSRSDGGKLTLSKEVRAKKMNHDDQAKVIGTVSISSIYRISVLTHAVLRVTRLVALLQNLSMSKSTW